VKIVLGIFGQPATKALPFAKAAINAGHAITQVFFYGDGVLCANPDWLQISKALFICSTSAIKRNITEGNLIAGFEMGGLGQFMHALKMANRYMIFGY
jgi:sulfur relay (sulfurtransferase) complex TusBCD TusD component (DsrE family)